MLIDYDGHEKMQLQSTLILESDQKESATDLIKLLINFLGHRPIKFSNSYFIQFN